MPPWLAPVLGFLKALIQPLMMLFIHKDGENKGVSKQVTADLKKEVEDANEAAQIRSRIDVTPINDIRDVMFDHSSTNDNDDSK